MTNLLAQVTPLTKGVLWFTNGAVSTDLVIYKDVDYLLNGLLTATLNSTTTNQSHVLVSENFGNPFYVIIGNEFKDSEISSFIDLVKPHMMGDNHLVLIDENSIFAKFQKLIPAEIKSKILQIQ